MLDSCDQISMINYVRIRQLSNQKKLLGSTKAQIIDIVVCLFLAKYMILHNLMKFEDMVFNTTLKL